MAIGKLLTAAIPAAASLAGQAANAISAGKMNKRGEQFAYRMYAQQRADAKSDWAMQNAYNDPSAQMARLKAAGLNPNLVYGNGADAQASSSVRSSSASQPSYKVPQFDTGAVAFQAMQMRQLQSNIARTDAETARIQADTDKMVYGNRFLTDDMFQTEYEHRAGSARFDLVGKEASATIKKLEAETKTLMAGHGANYSPLTKSGMDEKTKPNLMLEELKTKIAKDKATLTGIDFTNKMKEYEADIIKNLGVSGADAKSIISNVFRLILMYTSKR